MKKNQVHREHQRLERLFRRALLVALAVPAAVPVACSAPAPGSRGSGGASHTRDGAGGDSSTKGSRGEGGAPEAGMPETGAPEAGSGGAPSSPEDGGVAADAAEEASCAPYPVLPSPPDLCGDHMRLPCGLPAGITPGSNCYLFIHDCTKICPGPFQNCHADGLFCDDGGTIVPDPEGGVEIDCAFCAGGVGRVPEGLAPVRMAPAPPLGRYFAAAAHLEAASVHAFRRLGRELAAHGAPAPLRRAASRAARDEVRHARVAAALARRFGGTPVAPCVPRGTARPLEAVALENAVEGCVRETFGALMAAFQAAHARDPGVACQMATIARDEARHAALSWAVARWASPRLDAGARARIEARCREAAAALRREAGAPVARELRERAGLPSRAQRRALLDAVEADLWGSIRVG